MCFVWRREQVAGVNSALVFAAGTTDVWLCKRPALWADETAAKCVQLLRNEWPTVGAHYLCSDLLNALRSRLTTQLHPCITLKFAG